MSTTDECLLRKDAEMSDSTDTCSDGRFAVSTFRASSSTGHPHAPPMRISVPTAGSVPMAPAMRGRL
jgi:hypothetical protein